MHGLDLVLISSGRALAAQGEIERGLACQDELADAVYRRCRELGRDPQPEAVLLEAAGCLSPAASAALERGAPDRGVGWSVMLY